MRHTLKVPADNATAIRYHALTYHMHKASRINKLWYGGNGYSFYYEDGTDVLVKEDELTRIKVEWELVLPVEWRDMDIVVSKMTDDEFVLAFDLFVKEFES